MKQRCAALMVFLALGLSACATDPPRQTGPLSPPPERVIARWDNLSNGAAWTGFAMEALDRFGGALVSSVPSDIESYCPAYPSMPPARRKAFWVGLMSALTKWESSYDPDTKFVEPDVVDAQGRNVTSRGLLQISIESGRGYGCTIENEQQLHDPKVNLTCAVRILNRLVPRAGVVASNSAPWKGAAAYWSPFRRADRRADMRNWTKSLQICTP